MYHIQSSKNNKHKKQVTLTREDTFIGNVDSHFTGQNQK